jgi:hypothetical protein
MSKEVKQYRGAKWQANIFIEKYGNFCGSGSTLESTIDVRDFLPKIFKKYGIKSMVDAPCGDFSWMKTVNLEGVDYCGYDILDFVLEAARNNGPGKNFILQDIIDLPINKADLIQCRDFLFHIENQEILKVIDNFKRSGSTYLLSTTFKEINVIYDLSDEEKTEGYGWRPINLELDFYGLGTPLERIDETGPRVKGRSVGLWKLN